MKKCWCIAVLLWPIQLLAQDSCSCLSNLDRYIDLVTRNYAGYHDKVKPENQAQYQVLLDSLRYVASITSDRTVCFGVLDTYRAFFWDKHLQLGGPNMPSASGDASGSPPIATNWTAATLKTYFTEHGDDLRSLEGVWTLDAYEVGIVYDPATTAYQAVIFKAAIPNWKEGMVKFTCPEPENGRSAVRYWRGDLGMMETSALFVQDHLLLDRIGTWRRVLPVPKEPLDERTFELNYGSEVQWRLLDDSTLYIKLGSCQLTNKAVLDSLVAASKTLLARIPNWIVDFRDNGGGSTDVFQSLLPYLYTKPFREYGVNHWLSPENTMVLKDFLQENEKMMDGASARSVKELVKQGEKHPGTWHIDHGATTRFKTHDMPRRVAILANRYTASSGEAFLEIARGMSDKSVIFGENTGGYMDYGDVMPHDLGCDGLGAAIPTSRMNRIDHGLSYDRNGITPDVLIGIEENDWIGTVRNYWAQQRTLLR
jgi:hypothetical protein